MAAAAAAAVLLLRGGAPLLRWRIPRAAAVPPRCCCYAAFPTSGGQSTTADPSRSPAEDASASAAAAGRDLQLPPPPSSSWGESHSEYRRWKDREAEILEDIEPITALTKDILHSRRYMDGEPLNAEDEKEVVEKLLIHHPHSEDKIGCGLDSIMVDRHPQFKQSRCLFVVRTDGRWIDFSYQKCLRAYIRDKYPAYAERFIREHFKRT